MSESFRRAPRGARARTRFSQEVPGFEQLDSSNQRLTRVGRRGSPPVAGGSAPPQRFCFLSLSAV